MRVLLSTIGSRGDVQPLVALALQLRELDQEVRLCAPPDFRDWIDTFGIPFVAIGPEVRSTATSSSPFLRTRPTPEQMRQIAEAAVATQFAVIPAAAGRLRHPRGRRSPANRPSLGGRAKANLLRLRQLLPGVPALPSPHHAPPAWVGDSRTDGAADNRRLWAEDAQRWNASCPDQADHTAAQVQGRFDDHVSTHGVANQHDLSQPQLLDHRDYIVAETRHRP